MEHAQGGTHGHEPNGEVMTSDEMIEELVQFYEAAAGFADYWERELKGKSDAEIADIYTTYLKATGVDAEK